jgi:hypothetical protein
MISPGDVGMGGEFDSSYPFVAIIDTIIINDGIQSCLFSVSSVSTENLYRNAHGVCSDIYGLVVLVSNKMQ